MTLPDPKDIDALDQSIVQQCHVEAYRLGNGDGRKTTALYYGLLRPHLERERCAKEEEERKARAKQEEERKSNSGVFNFIVHGDFHGGLHGSSLGAPGSKVGAWRDNNGSGTQNNGIPVRKEEEQKSKSGALNFNVQGDFHGGGNSWNTGSGTQNNEIAVPFVESKTSPTALHPVNVHPVASTVPATNTAAQTGLVMNGSPANTQQPVATNTTRNEALLPSVRSPTAGIVVTAAASSELAINEGLATQKDATTKTHEDVLDIMATVSTESSNNNNNVPGFLNSTASFGGTVGNVNSSSGTGSLLASDSVAPGTASLSWIDPILARLARVDQGALLAKLASLDPAVLRTLVARIDHEAPSLPDDGSVALPTTLATVRRSLTGNPTIRRGEYDGEYNQIYHESMFCPPAAHFLFSETNAKYNVKPIRCTPLVNENGESVNPTIQFQELMAIEDFVALVTSAQLLLEETMNRLPGIQIERGWGYEQKVKACRSILHPTHVESLSWISDINLLCHDGNKSELACGWPSNHAVCLVVLELCLAFKSYYEGYCQDLVIEEQTRVIEKLSRVHAEEDSAIKELKATIAEIKSHGGDQVQCLKAQLNKVKADLESETKKVTKLKRELEEEQAHTGHLESEIRKLNTWTRQLEDEKGGLEQRVRDLQWQVSDLQQQLDRMYSPPRPRSGDRGDSRSRQLHDVDRGSPYHHPYPGDRSGPWRGNMPDDARWRGRGGATSDEHRGPQDSYRGSSEDPQSARKKRRLSPSGSSHRHS